MSIPNEVPITPEGLEAVRLRPAMYRDGGWTIDYRRLRVIAVKPE